MKVVVNFRNLILGILVMGTSLCAYSQWEEDDRGVFLQVGVSTVNLNYNKYSYQLGTTTPVYLGYDFNKNLGVELMGASASTQDYSTTLSFSGFYIKPKLPLGESFEVFGRLGSNKVTLTTTYGSAYNSSASYGVGLTAYMTPEKKDFLSVDYMHWYGFNGYTLTGVGVAFGHKF